MYLNKNFQSAFNEGPNQHTFDFFFSKCVFNTDINTLWKKNQKTNVAWKFFLYKILKDNYWFF